MNERVKKLAEEAKKLTHDERVELYEELLVSFIGEQAGIEQSWAEEAERRLQAYKRGEMAAIPAETVLARLGRTST